MSFFILDLDGCVCDERHRHHLIDGTRKVYEDYHAECHKDTPMNVERIFVLRQILQPLVITGRTERNRDKTVEWLARHFGFLKWEQQNILMRPDGCLDPSEDLKISLLDEWRFKHIYERDDIVIAFDDRDKILDRYAAEGIKAEKLTYGGFHASSRVI